MKKLQLLLWMLTASASMTIHAQDLAKGWDAFKTNDLKKARKHFEAATRGSDKAEAFLMLSVLDNIDKTADESFIHFQQFFESSSNPYPYLFALWSTGSLNYGRGLMTKEQVPFFELLAEDPKTPGTIRSMANQTLGSHYEDVGDFKKAHAAYDQVGSVTTWSAVGEFENISESGFNKNYDPITKPKSTETFTNKKNAPVKWFVLPAYRNDRWVDFEYHFFTTNSIIYAQTFVTSSGAKDVQLRLGTSGSIKLWLNDRLIFEEREERNNDMDTYIIRAKLSSGKNRILVQLGSSEIDQSNFLLRITDEKGENIPGLQFDATGTSYKEAASFEPEVLPVFAEAYFTNQMEKEPDDLLNYVMLAETYLRNDKASEARHVLNMARKLAPECSYIVWMLCEVYQREEIDTELSKSLEWLKDHDPNNPGTLQLIWNEQTVDKEDWDAAEETLKKLEAIFGKNEDWYEKKLDIAGHFERNDEIFSLIDEAYDKFPDNYSYVYLKYLLEKEARSNTAAAMSVLKKYTKAHYSVDAKELMANIYFEQGNVSKGLALFESFPVNDPIAVGYYSSLYDIYMQLQWYPQAMEEVENMLRIAPYVGSYWNKKGDIYEAQKNEKQAIECYEKCLLYYPTNYDVRDKLRTMKGKPAVWSYFTEEDVYETYKKAPAATQYPEDNSIILLDNTRRVIYGNGAAEEKRTLLVKMFNATGVDSWKDYYIPVYSMQNLVVEKAEVIKASGAKIEAERSYSRVVFTGLEVGDAVHVTYKVQDYRSGKLAPHFWDKIYFSRFYPNLKMRYSVMTMPDYKFKYVYSNGNLEPTIETKDEFKKYVWEKSDQPSIKEEAYMPAVSDMGEVLTISSFDNWDWIADWYSDLAREKAKSDFDVKELAAELFAEEDMTEMEKARTIYDYIVNNIRYSSIPFMQSGLIPQKASSVINSKIGDCKDVSTLFVALSREAGIDANLVLVNTRERGDYGMRLPSIDFNHCIAKVTVDEQPYYIELTSDYYAFSTFSRYLEKAFALEISGEGENVTVEPLQLDPPTRLKNTTVRKTTLALAPDGSLHVSKDNVKAGFPAASMRGIYRDLGEEARRKNLLESLSDEYPNLSLKGFVFTEGLDTVASEVAYKYDYVATDVLAEVGGGMKLLKLPWSEQVRSIPEFLSLEKRVYDVDFWEWTNDDSDEEVMEITVPANMKLVELPKNMTYSSSIATYSLTFEKRGQTIIAKRSMKYNQDHDRITTDEYNTLKEFYGKIVKADKTQLAFR
jgi:tetratricopeptide (TPR) repeat protein